MYTASATNSKLNYILPKAPRGHVLKHNGKSGSGPSGQVMCVVHALLPKALLSNICTSTTVESLFLGNIQSHSRYSPLINGEGRTMCRP